MGKRVVFCFDCGQAIEAPDDYEPKKGDLVLCMDCFSAHPPPSSNPQLKKGKLLFAWESIIAKAEAALERERATISPEIEKIHELMGRSETGIGLTLIDIITAAEAKDAVKLDASLRDLRGEIPHLSQRIRTAGAWKA